MFHNRGERCFKENKRKTIHKFANNSFKKTLMLCSFDEQASEISISANFSPKNKNKTSMEIVACVCHHLFITLSNK